MASTRNCSCCLSEHPALGAATELQAEREGAAEDGEREAADQT